MNVLTWDDVRQLASAGWLEAELLDLRPTSPKAQQALREAAAGGPWAELDWSDLPLKPAPGSAWPPAWGALDFLEPNLSAQPEMKRRHVCRELATLCSVHSRSGALRQLRKKYAAQRGSGIKK